MAQLNDVDPAFAKAVAVVESRNSKYTLRTGRMGKSKFYAPMGINKCFLKQWAIDNTVINIWIGVRALRGSNTRRVLHRYNPKATPAYIAEVSKLTRRYSKKSYLATGN